jgi:hypothetical protein
VEDVRLALVDVDQVTDVGTENRDELVDAPRALADGEDRQ